MSNICAEPLCRINDYLVPQEADRVKRLLARIRWGLLPVEQVPLLEEDAVLRHCPYLKAAGPSSLCASQCHLHHMVFTESWP